MKVKIFHLHLLVFLAFMHYCLSDHELFSLLHCSQCSSLWHAIQSLGCQLEKNSLCSCFIMKSIYAHVLWKKNLMKQQTVLFHPTSGLLTSVFYVEPSFHFFYYFPFFSLAIYLPSFKFQNKWLPLKKTFSSSPVFYLIRLVPWDQYP